MSYVLFCLSKGGYNTDLKKLDYTSCEPNLEYQDDRFTYLTHTPLTC